MYKFCDVYKCVHVLCLCTRDVMYTSFQGSLAWSCGCVGLLGFGFWKSRTPAKRFVVWWVRHFRNVYGRKVSSMLLLACLGP